MIKANQHVLHTRWQELVESMRRTAASADYRAFPGLAASIDQEVGQFAALPTPHSEAEWQARRRLAAATRKKWSVSLSNIRTGKFDATVKELAEASPWYRDKLVE